jgi:hypothetical protein
MKLQDFVEKRLLKITPGAIAAPDAREKLPSPVSGVGERPLAFRRGTRP